MINWAGSYHNYSSPPQYGRQEIIVCKESFNVFQLWEDHVRSVHFSAVWPRLCCQYIFMSKILAEALSITIREIDFYLIFLMKWWRWDINRQDDSTVQCDDWILTVKHIYSLLCYQWHWWGTYQIVIDWILTESPVYRYENKLLTFFLILFYFSRLTQLVSGHSLSFKPTNLIRIWGSSPAFHQN